MGCLSALKATFLPSRTANQARTSQARNISTSAKPQNMESIFAAQAKFKADRGLTKVKVVPNKHYKRHGTKSYVHLMNKYGFEPTKPGPYFMGQSVHQRGLAGHDTHVGGRVHKSKQLRKKTDAAGTQSGEVTAEDQQGDSEYLCEVSIGTPAQNLLLDFDTGSSDLWVFSTSLSQSSQKGHTIFDPSKSSTFKNLPNESWKISYGDGSSASGTCGSDTVTIGGLAIKNQTVELASQLAQQFASGTGDGLLGLAWPSINTVTSNGQSDPAQTPVANMISEGDVPQASQLFTVALYSDRDGNGADSFYTFGYIDQDLVTASGQDIKYTDIDNSQGFWMFDSASATVNGKSIAVSGNTAIADTGTTLALVSDQVCEALYNAIPGASYDQSQQGYTFPTSVKASDLPTLQVAVGDNMFTIQPEDLCFASAGNDMWYGGVQSRGSNPFDILGDVFLKSVYAVFDQGNKRWGAVPKIQATQNLNPPAATS